MWPGVSEETNSGVKLSWMVNEGKLSADPDVKTETELAALEAEAEAKEQNEEQQSGGNDEGGDTVAKEEELLDMLYRPLVRCAVNVCVSHSLANLSAFSLCVFPLCVFSLFDFSLISPSSISLRFLFDFSLDLPLPLPSSPGIAHKRPKKNSNFIVGTTHSCHETVL